MSSSSSNVRKRRRAGLDDVALDDIGEPEVEAGSSGSLVNGSANGTEFPGIRRENRDSGLGLWVASNHHLTQVPSPVVMTPGSNTFRILIATDNHLGYKENDPILKDDSFNAFEEILQIAVDNNVDFLLLGGDLFHENKPSRQCIYRCQTLLKKYCFGDRPVAFEIRSDQKRNFPVSQRVNYEDPNVNISLPVFIVHGNHDDPAGRGGLSALDLLSAGSLLNYFGKVEKVDDIEIHPILMQKGNTRIALYGLGNVRDERLHNTFKSKKTHLTKALRPASEPTEWYNMFVIHQNRTQHSSLQKSYIAESFLPGFIDFVIWGHEHECIIEPQHSQNGFMVLQPGSSVATSLCGGEAVQKRVAIMEIRRKPERSHKRQKHQSNHSAAGASSEEEEEEDGKYQYRMVPQPLRTVRSMIISDIKLSDALSPSDPKLTERMDELLSQRVEEMIEATLKEWMEQPWRRPEDTEKDFPLPLIRVRVEHTGFPKLNVQRFGGQFVSRVANPEDLLSFHKQRRTAVAGGSNNGGGNRQKTGAGRGSDLALPDAVDLEDQAAALAARGGDPEAPPPIHEMVGPVLAASNRSLSLLSEDQFGDAVSDFVQKNETQAIASFLEQALARMQADLEKATAGRPATREEVLAAVAERRGIWAAEMRGQEKHTQKSHSLKSAGLKTADSSQNIAGRVRQANKETTKARAAARRGKSRVQDEDDDVGGDSGGGMEDESDDSDLGPAVGARANAKAPRKSRNAAAFDHGDDDDEDSAEQKGGAEDEESDRPPPRRQAKPRAHSSRRKQVIIDLDDDSDYRDQSCMSEEDSVSEADDSDHAPRARAKAKRSVASSSGSTSSSVKSSSTAGRKKPVAAAAPAAASRLRKTAAAASKVATRGSKKASAEDDLDSLMRARAKPKKEPRDSLAMSGLQQLDLLSLDDPGAAVPRVKQERRR